MDELTNHYFNKWVSGVLSIGDYDILEGRASIYINDDFKIFGSALNGIYAKERNLLCAVFAGIRFKDYMSYTNETEEFTDFEPIGRN